MAREPTITVEHLHRDFKVTERKPGFAAAVRSVVRRKFRTIHAVVDVSFEVYRGEIVSFLGPNGAGKTTMLKCVAGLLTPTSGTVDALGFVPSERRREYLRQLGFVMGQRWQLHMDLPVADSFEINRATYEIPDEWYAESRDELVELLELEPLLRQPARELSLGQRMRCEFAAALLHRPRIVLLDEPTLGLDFDAQEQIRTFVREYARRYESSVLLTSHYLADIEALSDRVMTLSKGRITFHGTFAELRARAGNNKRLTVHLRAPLAPESVAGLGDVLDSSDTQLVLDVERSFSGPAISKLQTFDEVADIALGDPPLEETLSELYKS